MDLNIGEAQLIVAISEAIEGERVHVAVPLFTARLLAQAANTNPNQTDYLLHRLSVFHVRGYQRSTAELVAAIEEVLPMALAVVEEHRAQLLEGGIPIDDPEVPPPDSVGVVILGDWEFAP